MRSLFDGLVDPLYYDTGDQLKAHIYGRMRAATHAGFQQRADLRSKKQIEARVRKLRRFFISALGGIPKKLPKPVGTVTGIVTCPSARIEKIVFESRPGVPMTGNLYLPHSLKAPVGAVLFLCGHNLGAKHCAEYQIVCQIAAKRGLVVFAVDPIGQGERLSYLRQGQREPAIAWGSTEHEHVGAQCIPLGDRLGRYFLADAIQAFNYLASRPEVDAKRIGVSGNSGGGCQTAMMMIAEPRLAAAAPATFIMNLAENQAAGIAQDAEQIWPGFASAGFDHADILMAMAPKPVCVLAVTSDFFPIEATRSTVAEALRYWHLYDQPEKLEYHEDCSRHYFTELLAHRMAAFFARHLLDKCDDDICSAHKVISEKRLWCTNSGQVGRDFPKARTVFGENLVRLRETSASPSGRKITDWLKRKIFSHRTASSLNPRFYQDEIKGTLSREAAFWWSQPDLINSGHLFRQRKSELRTTPVIIAVWDGGTHNIHRHKRWIESHCRSERAVLVLNVSGTGAVAPNTTRPHLKLTDRFGTIDHFCDGLEWLDDSLAALRTYDVIRCIDLVFEWKGLSPGPISLYGHGLSGTYARLASIIDGRVKDFQGQGDLKSYATFVRNRYYKIPMIKSVLINGFLKYGDLDALACKSQPSKGGKAHPYSENTP